LNISFTDFIFQDHNSPAWEKLNESAITSNNYTGKIPYADCIMLLGALSKKDSQWAIPSACRKEGGLLTSLYVFLYFAPCLYLERCVLIAEPKCTLNIWIYSEGS